MLGRYSLAAALLICKDVTWARQLTGLINKINQLEGLNYAIPMHSKYWTAQLCFSSPFCIITPWLHQPRPLNKILCKFRKNFDVCRGFPPVLIWASSTLQNEQFCNHFNCFNLQMLLVNWIFLGGLGWCSHTVSHVINPLLTGMLTQDCTGRLSPLGLKSMDKAQKVCIEKTKGSCYDSTSLAPYLLINFIYWPSVKIIMPSCLALMTITGILIYFLVLAYIYFLQFQDHIVYVYHEIMSKWVSFLVNFFTFYVRHKSYFKWLQQHLQNQKQTCAKNFIK